MRLPLEGPLTAKWCLRRRLRTREGQQRSATTAKVTPATATTTGTGALRLSPSASVAGGFVGVTSTSTAGGSGAAKTLVMVFNEDAEVVIPAPVGDLERVAPGQRGQVRRQVVLLRRWRSSDEHGDDPDVASLEGGGHLDPDKIVRVVESAPSAVVCGRDPIGPDYGDQNPAGADGGLDVLDEVDAGLHGVDVHKDPLRAELPLEALVDSPRIRRGGATAVADEDV